MNPNESTSHPPVPRHLGYQWYAAKDTPQALSRAEARTKNPWVMDLIAEKFFYRTPRNVHVLDLGCGSIVKIDLRSSGARGWWGIDRSDQLNHPAFRGIPVIHFIDVNLN